MAWLIVKNKNNKYNIWSTTLDDYLLDLWLSKQMVKIEYVNGRIARHRDQIEEDFEDLIKYPRISFEECEETIALSNDDEDE